MSWPRYLLSVCFGYPLATLKTLKHWLLPPETKIGRIPLGAHVRESLSEKRYRERDHYSRMMIRIFSCMSHVASMDLHLENINMINTISSVQKNVHSTETNAFRTSNSDSILTKSIPSPQVAARSFLKQVVWVFHWLKSRIPMNSNCCQCAKGPDNLSGYRMAHNIFLFTWISCDIQSTYPFVVSVRPWLIDCSSALHPSALSTALQ